MFDRFLVMKTKHQIIEDRIYECTGFYFLGIIPVYKFSPKYTGVQITWED